MSGRSAGGVSSRLTVASRPAPREGMGEAVAAESQLAGGSSPYLLFLTRLIDFFQKAKTHPHIGHCR